MPGFSTYIDIANRACQHMGVRQIDLMQGFNEDSLQAFEIGQCFDKLRLAELRRNLWRFSTRRAVLRPVGLNTMILKPPLWSQYTTYFPGAIVSTVDGALWFTTTPGNIGNPPNGSEAWDGYFGAMTADPLMSGTAYYAGDLAYTVAPNGIPSVYLSLVNGNSDVPGTPTPWVATQYFFNGQVVINNGTLYQSLIDLNFNNIPGFAPALYVGATTYAAGAQVTASDAVTYTSLVAGNTGHNPANGANPTYWQVGGLSNPAAWVNTTSYAAGAQVIASDGIIYSSNSTNTGHSPANGVNPTYWTSTGAFAPWTTTITNGIGGSLKWALISVALEKLTFAYPIGCGPAEESGTRNVYHLPSGFLREAPQNPNAGAVTFLGGPSGNQISDWEFESDYLITRDNTPITFRFGADIRGVQNMDPMFCEGLGARIGLECVERVTQSTGKFSTILATYKAFMGDARAVNGIETGPVEAPEDDFISCRI